MTGNGKEALKVRVSIMNQPSKKQIMAKVTDECPSNCSAGSGNAARALTVSEQQNISTFSPVSELKPTYPTPRLSLDDVGPRFTCGWLEIAGS